MLNSKWCSMFPFGMQISFLGKFGWKSQNCEIKMKLDAYNPGHNILELYNVLVQVGFAKSKTKLDI